MLRVLRVSRLYSRTPRFVADVGKFRETRSQHVGGSFVQGRGVAQLATSQYQHDVVFRNRYVGIRSTGPPTNQRPTALLKRLLTGEPPSLFDMDGVA